MKTILKNNNCITDGNIDEQRLNIGTGQDIIFVDRNFRKTDKFFMDELEELKRQDKIMA